MSYVGTSTAAKLAGIGASTLRQWLRKRLLGEPRISQKLDFGGRRGETRVRMFDEIEVAAIKRFAARRAAERKADGMRRVRNAKARLSPQEKGRRQAARSGIRKAERLWHVAEWFQNNPLCDRNFRAWHDALKELQAAGVVETVSTGPPEADRYTHKLAPGIVDRLREAAARLKAEYLASIKPKHRPLTPWLQPGTGPR